MQRLLLCVDQSSATADAISFLAGAGLLDGSELRILCVLEEDTKQNRQIAATLLANSAQEVKILSPGTMVETVLETGTAENRILEQASEFDADMILLGSNPKSGIAKLFLSSVSQAVAERSQCPVMIAREHAPTNNVLICVDDSECSAEALAWLAEQPWAMKKNIGVLSVLKPINHSFAEEYSVSIASDMLLQQQCKDSLRHRLLERWCNKLATDLRRNKVDFVITRGDPVDIIMRSLERWSCELVVVGSHARSALGKMVLGSVSERIAAGASCAVAIVKGKQCSSYSRLLNAPETAGLQDVMTERTGPTGSRSSLPGMDFNGFMPYI